MPVIDLLKISLSVQEYYKITADVAVVWLLHVLLSNMIQQLMWTLS